MTSTLHIRPAQLSDIPAIATLADRIWRAHYPGIITIEQIDYMLGQRYNPSALQEQIEGAGQCFELAEQDGVLVGFIHRYRYSDSEMKLDKLYLDPQQHGQGLGSQMLQHVETAARAQGFRQLILAVNKYNQKAIAAYQRNGFTVREAVMVEIGHGFVMDDYVMEKTL